MGKMERQYQADLIIKIRHMFPGCVILKNDPGYMQGIPDLTIFYGERWAMLEVKLDEDSPEQPNQSYYIDLLNNMSFAAFIYPSNEEEILRDLQQAFRARRTARVPQRQ